MTHEFEEICKSVGIDINELEKMQLHIHKDNLLFLARCDYINRFHSFVLRDGHFPKVDQNNIPIAIAHRKRGTEKHWKAIQLIPLHKIIARRLGLSDS